MARSCDVLVAGLGAMGSAAVDHLAATDLDVVGVDPRRPPHAEGSHHGHTRIIRKAYFEHPAYVPWVQRAYELWGQLQADVDEELFVRTGGLHVSRPGGRQTEDARYAIQEHDLVADELDHDALVDRYPAFADAPPLEAIYSPHSGFLWSQRCIRAQLDRARSRGAELHTDTGLRSFTSTPEGVRAETTDEVVEAGTLVLAVGPWLPRLAPELPVPFEIERQVQFLFEPVRHAERFEPEAFPVFAFDGADGQVYYGVSVPGRGVKIAAHHGGETTTPEAVDRQVRDEDVTKVRGFLASVLPDLEGPPREAMVCLYTNTPDHHFLLDWHPSEANVLVVSPCSGHGFKFAPAIGEGVADLVTEGATRQPASLFHMGRFTSARS